MMSFRCLQLVVLTTVANIFINIPEVTGQGSIPGINRRDQRYYQRYEVLDPEGKYVLEWEVNWDRRAVMFNVTVQARGYVGFGLSANGPMEGADIVLGGVDRFGKSYFTDRHAVGNDEPRIDPSQDWKLHEARENRSHTFLSFSRAFDTCDENDYLINERDTIVLIWAYSDTDDTSQFHLGNRGKYQVYLLEPLAVPRSIKEQTFIPGPPSSSVLSGEHLRLWTLASRYTMPTDHTTYHCSMHKGPQLRRKHHVVGYQTRLESEEAIKHVHHIVLYRCTPPQNTTAEEFFERFVNHPGQQCYFMATPSGDIPTQYCTRIRYAFAIGMRPFFLPDNLGVSIGDTGPNEYYITQIHYDNPDRLQNVSLEINVDVYYTDRIRSNDAGVMIIGHHVVGSPSILIPPSSREHYIHGHCSPECTATQFPPEGIFISLVMLHTHNSGKKVRVRHFRGNLELPWISDDDNYSNNYQEFRLLNRDVNVRPGDQVTVACEYDNTWTNGSVVGGFSTKQMCLIYVFYYNALPDFGLCRSEIDDHRNLPQTVVCSASPFSSLNVVTGDGATLPKATLPNIVREYGPPPRACPSSGREGYGWKRYSHGPRIKSS